jgi:hypothetical protein
MFISLRFKISIGHDRQYCILEVLKTRIWLGKAKQQTKSMEIRSSEAASRSATQEIFNILWNRHVYNRVHKSPSLFPMLSQMNPVHSTPSYFSKIHFNIILKSRSRCS